jgi:molybdopterin-containing oxidoreductase family membrane subunit
MAATPSEKRTDAPYPHTEVALGLAEDQRVIEPGHDFTSVSEKIARVPLYRGILPGWLLGFIVAFAVMMGLMFALTWLVIKGTGIWGVNIPVGWGFAIINFVWWIGIGHAGTLISAILLLFRQRWRMSISRFAEAMTIFAVMCAGLFPVFHTGRPWLAYWLMPYPNSMNLWPQFRSPLIWDVFAVTTYMTVSILFWYVGLIPDLATMRDKAKNIWVKRVYGVVALGWRGSAMHWQRYENASLLLAGLATPLVLSVHTVVSFDFAVSLIPGWHATIFPPYFVAGAIYSGFAMVLTLAIPIRAYYGMEDFITMRHIQNMAKIMLATGLIVFYGYACEAFTAWYSASSWEGFLIKNRMGGNYWYMYWTLIFCNGLVPQLLWFKRVRTNTLLLFGIALIVNTGMWLERYVIVVTSLSRDFLPSSWGMYAGTMWDWMTYVGTLGLFAWLMFLFLRLLPMISMFEMRTILPRAGGQDTDEASGH